MRGSQTYPHFIFHSFSRGEGGKANDTIFTLVTVFSRKSDSTTTNVCLSPKPLNSLKSSSFFIHPSSFFIHTSSFFIHPSEFFIHPSFISRLLSFSACLNLMASLSLFNLFTIYVSEDWEGKLSNNIWIFFLKYWYWKHLHLICYWEYSLGFV